MLYRVISDIVVGLLVTFTLEQPSAVSAPQLTLAVICAALSLPAKIFPEPQTQTISLPTEPTMTSPQHDWLALPCTFLSILLTTVAMRALTSRTDKGLSTVLKATCAFVVILALTTFAARRLVSNGHYDDIEGENEEVEWRKERRETKKLTKEEQKERKKSVKRELMRRFFPKRNEMLGRRKEVVVEVLEEENRGNELVVDTEEAD